MEALARVGGVSMTKNKNVKWASPKPAGWEPRWTVAISLPGYTTTGASRVSIEATADTAIEAAQTLYQELEDFLYGEEGKAARDRYLHHYNVLLTRYENATTQQRHGFDPIRHPGEKYPDIKLG